MGQSDREPTAQATLRDRVLRPVLVVFCLLLTFEAAANLARWRSNRAELLETLAELGVEGIGRHRVSFERTAHHAQLSARW